MSARAPGRGWARQIACAWPLCALLGCAPAWLQLPDSLSTTGGVGESAAAYRPDRRDYASFREAQPGLLEPNYLPFMLHRFGRDAARGDALVFCRWSEEQMPIPVSIRAPKIDAALQDEFHPRHPQEYVRAAAEALEVWQNELEGLVRFRRVGPDEDDALSLQLVGDGVAPEAAPGRRRLGFAKGVLGACRAHGWDEGESERLHVRFRPKALRVHLADEAGLLPPRLVRRLVVHELGHALGMRGHSPSPGDVMYARIGERAAGDELSLQDVNSFVSLYRLPNGTLFGDLPLEGQAPRPPPLPPAGPPMLSVAPWVDAREGFELHLPAGWLRFEEPHGLFAANGPSWDYDASLRVFVWPSKSIEDFLDCCARALLEGSWLRRRGWSPRSGRRTLEWVAEDASGRRSQQYSFIEIGDGRVMMIAAEMPVENVEGWQPWLRACLDSLRIWPPPSSRAPGVHGAGTAARAESSAADLPFSWPQDSR